MRESVLSFSEKKCRVTVYSVYVRSILRMRSRGAVMVMIGFHVLFIKKCFGNCWPARRGVPVQNSPLLWVCLIVHDGFYPTSKRRYSIARRVKSNPRARKEKLYTSLLSVVFFSFFVVVAFCPPGAFARRRCGGAPRKQQSQRRDRRAFGGRF